MRFCLIAILRPRLSLCWGLRNIELRELLTEFYILCSLSPDGLRELLDGFLGFKPQIR